MSASNASAFDKTLAGVCAKCPVCRRARRRQRGLAFQLVQIVEARLCPFCRAYERVHGRKAHEPLRNCPSAAASVIPSEP